MLKSLQVKNYVLIDSLDVVFGVGLVIITGRTGAGKSILLGALGLLTGSKADASMVGTAGDNCVVEGVFSASDELRPFFEDKDLPWDGGEVVIRRVLARSGRSRCFVNDEPVAAGMLQELSGKLIDIHSQNDNSLLKDKAFQLLMLDRFADNADLLDKCAAAWNARRDLLAEIQRLRVRLNELESGRDYNQAVYEILEKAALREGELEELEVEQKQLANAAEIKDRLYFAEKLLSGSDDSASVDSVLKEASKSLDKISAYSAAASSLSARLESSRLEIDDILSELGKLESSVEISPHRLEAVEDRMSLLYGLMNKHSVSDIASLISVRDSLSEQLYDSSAIELQIAQLEKDAARVQDVFATASQQLSLRRREAAGAFASSVLSILRSLELDRAEFSVDVIPSQDGPAGSDSVVFRFSSTGRAPEDVAKVASGGEVSRIMLSLKAMMARYSDMPSLVFDEIDTGVSGSAADSIGTLICEMGKDMQVFAITHLPQVAAKGEYHYLVEKTDGRDGRSETSVKKISGESRVMEIARMLSGSEITPQAVANARALLSE